jgi:PPM family protein phosphatase
MGFIRNLFARAVPDEAFSAPGTVAGATAVVEPARVELPSYWLESASLTDVGLVRSNNEDNVKLMPDPSSGLSLALLADGMGGHASGELASALALETIMSRYAARKPHVPLEATVREAIEAANLAVFRHAQENPECTGMGTTVCVLAFGPSSVCLGWVGDSRIYCIRDGRLQQLTRDDTMVNRLLDDGVLTPEQADRHPDAHVLSQALGTHESLQQVHAVPLDRGPEIGDTYLLTSDGVHDLLSAAQMVSIVSENDVHRGVAQLIEAAKKAGSSDNLSAILVRVESRKNRKAPLAATRY